MRKLSLFVLIFTFTAIFSVPLSAAGTGDGVTPSQEGVCDGLKTAAGITKGLYGLCVAYCEAEANSESVLANYNSRRAANDPPMPCLEVDPPEVVECPCWDTERLAGASVAAVPNYCFIILESAVPTYSTAVYGDNDVSFVNLINTDGSGCAYSGPDGFSLALTTPEQHAVCQDEIEALIATDFAPCVFVF